MSATGDIEQQTNEISASNKESSEMEQSSDVDSVQVEQSNLDGTGEVLQAEESCDNVDKDSRDKQECESLQVELAQDVRNTLILEPTYNESNMSATGNIEQQTNESSGSNKESSEMEQLSDVDSVQVEQPNLDGTGEVLQAEISCDNIDKDSRDKQEYESLQVELAQDVRSALILEPIYNESKMSATSDIEQQINESSGSNKESSMMEQTSDVDLVQVEQPNLDGAAPQTEKSCDNVDIDSNDKQECESLQIEQAQDAKDALKLEPTYNKSSIIENPLSTAEIDSINNIITEDVKQDLVESVEQDNPNDNSNLKNSQVAEDYQTKIVCSEDVLPLKEEKLIDIGENYDTSYRTESLLGKNESTPVLFSEQNISIFEEIKASENIEEFISVAQIPSNATDGNLLHFDEINEHQRVCTTEEILLVSEDICEERFSEAEIPDNIVDNINQDSNSSTNSDSLQNEKVYLDNILDDFPGDKIAVDEDHILNDVYQPTNETDISDSQVITEKIDVDVCTSNLTYLEEAEVVNISDKSENIDQLNITEKVNDLQSENIFYNDHAINLPIDKTIIVNDKNILDQESKINENIDDSNEVEIGIITDISESLDKIENLNINGEVTDNCSPAKLSEDTLSINNTDSLLTQNICDNKDSNLYKIDIVTDDENLLTEEVVSTCTNHFKSLEKIDSAKTEVSDNLQQKSVTDNSLNNNELFNKMEDISNKCILEQSNDLTEKVVTDDKSITFDNKHFSNFNDELIATNTLTSQHQIIDIEVEPLILNETNKIDNEILLESNKKFSDISDESVKDQLSIDEEEKLKNKGSMINKSVISDNKVKPLILNQTNMIDEKKSLKSRENSSNTLAKVIKSSNSIKSDNLKSNATESSATASSNVTMPNLINKLQNMNWLRTQSSLEENMSRNSSTTKTPLKGLPKKDERSEDYFEGTKKNFNNRRRNSGQGRNRNTRSNLSTSEVKKVDPPKERNVEQSKNLQEQNASTSTIWNADTANKLFPNVQSAVIDRAKEEEDFNQAVFESICTAQKESEQRKKTQGALKIHILDEDNDEWGKIRPNLPDDVPKEADNVNAYKSNQNPGTGFIDKYGRVDGYSEKHLFMGKGGRRKEQEFLKAQTENKPQPNQNQPSSLQTLPTAKKVSDQSNNQHMKDAKKESDILKAKEATNASQQVVPNKKDPVLPNKSPEPRSIHGRFGKEDGFVEKQKQKSGFRQEMSKDIDQSTKVNQIQGQSSNNISTESNERNQNNNCRNQSYQDKNQADPINKNNPDRIEETPNKNLHQNQSNFNRPQNHADQNRSAINRRPDNFNRNHTDNRSQENTNRNNDFHNRNQNYSNMNREAASRGQNTYTDQTSNRNQENTNKREEENWDEGEKLKTNLQKHSSNTQQPIDNQKDTRNQTNDQNSQRYSSSTQQQTFNQRGTRNQMHDSDMQRYSNNSQHQNFNQRDPRNSSHNSNLQQNLNQRDSRNSSHDSNLHQNFNQRDPRNQSHHSNLQRHSSNTQPSNYSQRDTKNMSHDTNMQRYSNNTQQQAYNQRDVKSQAHDSKFTNQQNMKFEQQRNSESQKDKISNISQNVDHTSQTNIRKEKDYVNPNLSINNVVPKEQPKEITRTFNHTILTSAAPISTLAQIKNESQQSVLKTDTGITFGTVQEYASSELRPNVVMSFEGNQNIQRALGLNPNVCNSVQIPTTSQKSTVHETSTSTGCIPLNPTPSHLSSSMISNQNHPTALFSQQPVSCSSLNPSIMLPNSMMQADVPPFEASNLWQNQGLQSQFSVGMDTVVPNMPFDLSPASNNSIIDQQLRMNEISNDSLEFMQLHSNVATLSKQLAAAQAALLAAQWKFHQNHQASNPSNIQSHVADVNIAASSNQTINQAMSSRIVPLPANFMPMKLTVPPGFTPSMTPLQQSVIDDTMETPKNFIPVTMQDYLNERYRSNATMEPRLNLQTMYVQPNNLLQQQQAMHFQQYNVNGRGRMMPQSNEPKSQRSGGNQFYNQ